MNGLLLSVKSNNYLIKLNNFSEYYKTFKRKKSKVSFGPDQTGTLVDFCVIASNFLVVKAKLIKGYELSCMATRKM